MIFDNIINWIIGIVKAIINFIPTESPSMAQVATDQAFANLHVGTWASNSPIVVVVDLPLLAFVFGSSIAILSALFGAKIMVFLWQQIKW